MHGSLDWLFILVYWKLICIISGCFLMVVGGVLFLIREYRRENKE